MTRSPWDRVASRVLAVFVTVLVTVARPAPSPVEAQGAAAVRASLPPSPSAQSSLEVGEALAVLRADLDAILRPAQRDSARWSVLAVSLDRGDTLFARDAHESLVPASNLKLLTTAAALHFLGPDFRYQTFLLTNGEIDDGRLRGDLVLYGTGDPGISDRFFDEGRDVFDAFADSLLAAGITTVEGDLVGDATHFQGPLLGFGWDEDDLDDAFAAPSAALSFEENVVTVRVAASGPVGARPRIQTIPELGDVRLVNAARIDRRNALRVHREVYGGPLLVEGTIRRGTRDVWRQMTVADPARFTTHALRGVLESRGIRVLGRVRTRTTREQSWLAGPRVWSARSGAPRILARHVSPPLLEYVTEINKESHNLLADHVVKTLGRTVEGQGSFDGGARALGRYLRLAGIDPTTVIVNDGSGLSERNRLTTGTLVSLLSYVATTPYADVFFETLPEAGNARELRRMYRTAAARNLRAKTGTIAHVSALSGTVRAANGERIAFSIISNGVRSTRRSKRVEDRIGARLAVFSRPYTSESVGSDAPLSPR